MHPRFHPDCRLAGHLVPLYRAARVPVGRWCLCSPCLVALSAAAHASLLAVERGVSSLIPWNGISIARRGASVKIPAAVFGKRRNGAASGRRACVCFRLLRLIDVAAKAGCHAHYAHLAINLRHSIVYYVQLKIKKLFHPLKIN